MHSEEIIMRHFASRALLACLMATTAGMLPQAASAKPVGYFENRCSRSHRVTLSIVWSKAFRRISAFMGLPSMRPQ